MDEVRKGEDYSKSVWLVTLKKLRSGCVIGRPTGCVSIG